MKWKGQISVFLSLILISVCGLICGLLESARTAGARCFIQTAMHSAMDSLFSQYHRALWENYRIFGLEHREEEDLEEDFARFMEPYLKQGNGYPFALEDSQVTAKQTLTDDSGKYFQQEIMDYMKYGIWTKEWDEGSVGEAMDTLKEAGQISDMSRSMEVETKDAWKLEKALENLAECLKEQGRLKNQAAACLDEGDGSGFCKEGDKLIKPLEKVPRLVEAYEKQADRLGRQLDKLRADYEAKTPDVREEVRANFEDSLGEYASYVDQDGERRMQIAGLREKAAERIALVEKVQEEAEELEEFIGEWEPEDEDDELNTKALWEPIKRHFAQYQVLSLPFEAGIKDKEKEGLLKRLREMAQEGVLSLVLPKGQRVSEGMLNPLTGPSHQISYGEGDAGLLEKAMTAEYCQVFFNHFCDTGGKETAYEMEYLLFGEESDRENLTASAERLLAVREGMNLIHILGDSEKRNQARTLAAAIVGAFGLLPLVSITAFLIMGLWAFGEAVADVKALLSGGKVPVLKGKEDWSLSLDGLFGFAAGKGLEGSKNRESGLSYEQYLTIFLFFSPAARLLYRMMDVIEMNLKREQENFKLSRCAYRVDIQAQLCGKHVYFSLGLLKSMAGFGQAVYPLTASAAKAY